jgi:hypothetical protein
LLDVREKIPAQMSGHLMKVAFRTVGRCLTNVVLAAAASSVARAARAQIPGSPILQNVWATPGIVGAVNVGGGNGGTTYAAAASWSPASARFQLSGGGGFESRSENGNRGVYGARVAIPFGGAASSFGFAAFAGIGGGSGGSSTSTDSVASTTEIPIGASIGWRKAFGGNHGVSIYGVPAYVLYSGGSKNDGIFRGSIGADAGITRALGLTLGVEFGATRPRGFGGPTGTLFGAGVSYALGHR